MEELLNTLKFVHKMSADIIKFVCSGEICGFIAVYNSSYQVKCKAVP